MDFDKLYKKLMIIFKEYLYLANKLIENKDFFNSIVEKIKDNKHLIFNKKDFII